MFTFLGLTASGLSIISIIGSFVHAYLNKYDSSRQTEIVGILWAILAVLCLK